MKTSVIVSAVVLIIIAFGAWWYFGSNSNATGQTAVTTLQPTGTTPPAVTTQASTAPMSATVTYGPNGFTPSTVTIAKGGTVKWVAAAGADELWVASNPHPTHEGYDGTTKAQHCVVGYKGATPFDQCTTGTAYSFTFNSTGTWGYHNHGNHSDTGTVIVQ